MKLKLKMVMMFASVAVLAVCIVSIMGYTYMQKEVTRDINDKYLSMADALANKMDGWIIAKEKIIETAGATFDSLDEKNINEVQMKALNLESNKADISDLYAGFEDGRFVDGTGWIPPANYDPRKRPWYIETKAAGKLSINQPYLDLVTHQYALSIGYPLLDKNGKIRGVVSEDILLSRLTSMVNSVNIGAAGYAVLISADGVALAHPDKKLVNTNLKNNPDLKELINTLLPLEKGVLFYHYQGQDKMLFFQKMPTTNWTICIAVYKNVVYGGLNTLRMTYILLTLMVALIAVIIAYLLARSLTKPIREIDEKIQKVADGDLSVKIDVKGKDEIANLAVIGGGFAADLTFVVTGAGLVASPSPGSIFAEMAMCPKGGFLPVLAGIAVGAIVSFLIGALIVKRSNVGAEDNTFESTQALVKEMKAESKGNKVAAAIKAPELIIFACDAGMGSSAMGESILKKKLKDAGFNIKVDHFAVNEIPSHAEVVFTQESLALRASKVVPDAHIVTVKNFLDGKPYDDFISKLAK